MELFPKHIKINGQLVEVRDFLQETKGKADWEKKWVDLLKDWYSSSDFIEVKTSGSTGMPKVIQLKKQFVAASAKRTIDFFDLKENDRVLNCLSSRYIAGKLMTVRALVGKLDLKVVDPSSDFDFLEDESFKFAAMVPNQVQKVLNLQFATRNLVFLLIGGSAIPQSLEEKLQTISTQCYSSYGMTETATHIALRKTNGEDADGFYHCLNNIQVEKSDVGCLRIFLPGLDESPLQTNDLVELKDDKTFRIRGRADNVIISGGIKYSPEEIEGKLEPHISHPFYISSSPDETLGQQIILVVEATESELLVSFLKSICQNYLPKFEQPRKFLFREKLHRTDNGKLRRQTLK